MVPSEGGITRKEHAGYYRSETEWRERERERGIENKTSWTFAHQPHSLPQSGVNWITRVCKIFNSLLSSFFFITFRIGYRYIYIFFMPSAVKKYYKWSLMHYPWKDAWCVCKRSLSKLPDAFFWQVLKHAHPLLKYWCDYIFIICSHHNVM